MAIDMRRTQSRAGARVGEIDEGLRAHMLRVYNYMTVGLALTGIVAYLVASTPLGPAIFGSGLAIVVMLAPIGVVLFLSARIHKMSFASTQATFWVFATLMGLSLASVFMVYTGTSIARVFFITAATFASMSVYGYTTKRDLTGLGSFLFMGLIGIILASVINIFIGSAPLQYAISIIGVLIFVGLTAYDTQKIKEMYYVGDGTEVAGKKAIMGALRLYLDFINLFVMLLHLFGIARD